MDTQTLVLYLVMYAYGFGLTLWAIFFDKRPTKKTYYAGIIGFFILFLTLFYFAYVLLTVGITQ